MTPKQNEPSAQAMEEAWRVMERVRQIQMVRSIRALEQAAEEVAAALTAAEERGRKGSGDEQAEWYRNGWEAGRIAGIEEAARTVEHYAPSLAKGRTLMLAQLAVAIRARAKGEHP